MRVPRPLPLLVLALLLLGGTGAVVANYAVYGCLPEGRSEVFKNFTLPVTGALVADVRTRSAVTVEACETTHVELLSSLVRFRAEAGAYRLTVHMVDGPSEAYVLRPGDAETPQNATRWLEHDEVERVTYTGVSHDGVVSSNELPRRAGTDDDLRALQREISSVTTSAPEPRDPSPLLARRLWRMP